MESAFMTGVRPLLDLIERLQEIGIQAEISLPQIVVMGDQSSGKSSVLQSICGIPFPRGSGLVTRCPTQVIMSKSPAGSQWTGNISVNWSSSQPEQAGPVQTPEELCSKIVALTDFITANKQNSFSNDCLVIRISSPDSPNLTIVDLPGIVRTATQGQDLSVIAQINSLVEAYITLPNTIILAVVPCNQDIATVDILERANRVDPSGSRTIGVLTKPDLIAPCSEGEIVEVLQNTKKPLKLGYFMLKNMSQRQLNENTSNQEAWESEKQFFLTHEVFSQHLQLNVFGRDRLVEALTQLLVEKIKQSLPNIVRDLKILMAQMSAELVSMGPQPSQDNRELKSALLRLISKFCELLRQSTRGEYRDSGGFLSKTSSCRLHYQLRQSFSTLQTKIAGMKPIATEPEKIAFLDKLQQDMVQQKGRELPGFLSSQVFSAFVVDVVEQWRVLVEDCRADAIRSAQEVSALISSHVLEGHPDLLRSIQELTSSLLESASHELNAQLDVLLLREQDPFTHQQALVEVVNGVRCKSFEAVLRKVLDSTDVSTAGDMVSLREDFRSSLGQWYMMRHGSDLTGNKHELSTICQVYWDIASRRIIDNVCMCILSEVTKVMVQELEARCLLFGMGVEDDALHAVMAEDPTLTSQRAALKKRLDKVTKSLQAIVEYNGATSDGNSSKRS